MNNMRKWIEDSGGELFENDMVKCWMHDDQEASAKMYGNNRVHCFACGKTFFAPWDRVKPIRITKRDYDAYCKQHNATWPTINEVEEWVSGK